MINIKSGQLKLTVCASGYTTIFVDGELIATIQNATQVTIETPVINMSNEGAQWNLSYNVPHSPPEKKEAIDPLAFYVDWIRQYYPLTDNIAKAYNLTEEEATNLIDVGRLLHAGKAIKAMKR